MKQFLLHERFALLKNNQSREGKYVLVTVIFYMTIIVWIAHGHMPKSAKVTICSTVKIITPM